MKKKPPQNQFKSGQGYSHLLLPVVLLATFISLYPTLQNEFVNWDDIIYVMNNDLIKNLSFSNLSKIFSSFYMGNYHPLTMVSFAFDYSFVKITPYGYHLHNLLLHLANTALVYVACYLLLNNQVKYALFIALLFGIHPMHVESVAWMSERKDLLYTFYFLLGMITYLLYLKTNNWLYFLLTIIAFLFSLLSKAQAVTFPLVLLLVDFFKSRKITLKTVLEKVPYFALALVFGIIAIYAQRADKAVNPIGISYFDAFFYGNAGIAVYLYKFLLPFGLTCLHEYPFGPGSTLQWYFYLSPLVLLITGVILVMTWKKYPFISFGLLFFLMTILPVLQFLPVGQAFIAERYTYIPYIGIFVVVVILFFRALDRIHNKQVKLTVTYSGIAVLLLFSGLTYSRSQVWKDSISLWTDVLEKNPKCVSAYVNRGYIYIQEEQFIKAIDDCNAGLKIDSNYYKFYVNRAFASKHLGQYREAAADFSTAMKKSPEEYSMYLERGIVYTDNLNQYDLGIADFMNFLKYSKASATVLFNLSVAYLKKNIPDSALLYSNRAIRADDNMMGAHYVCAVVYGGKGDFQKAYFHAAKAKQLGYPVPDAELDAWKERS
ncbi:MAG: tetratricopeptide repeat protein, partial [bacterium]